MARRPQRNRTLRHDSDEDFTYSMRQPEETKEKEEDPGSKMVLRSSRKRARRVWTVDPTADDDEFKYPAESDSDEELIPPSKRTRVTRRAPSSRRAPKPRSGYNTRNRRKLAGTLANPEEGDDTEAAAASLLAFAEVFVNHGAQSARTPNRPNPAPVNNNSQRANGDQTKNGQQRLAPVAPPTQPSATPTQQITAQDQLYMPSAGQNAMQWKRCALHVRIAYHIFYEQKRSQLPPRANMFPQRVMVPLSLDPTLEARRLKEQNEPNPQAHMQMRPDTRAQMQQQQQTNYMGNYAVPGNNKVPEQTQGNKSGPDVMMVNQNQGFAQHPHQHQQIQQMAVMHGNQQLTQMANAQRGQGQKFPSIAPPVTRTVQSHSLPSINHSVGQILPGLANQANMTNQTGPNMNSYRGHSKAGNANHTRVLAGRQQLPSFNNSGSTIKLPPLGQPPNNGQGVQLPQILANRGQGVQHNVGPPLRQAEAKFNVDTFKADSSFGSRELPSIKNLDKLSPLPNTLPPTKLPPTTLPAATRTVMDRPVPVPSFDGPSFDVTKTAKPAEPAQTKTEPTPTPTPAPAEQPKTTAPLKMEKKPPTAANGNGIVSDEKPRTTTHSPLATPTLAQETVKTTTNGNEAAQSAVLVKAGN